MRNWLLYVTLLLAVACGDGGSTTNILLCDNSGPGTQTCIDGNGNVTDSPCVTINGVLSTSTGGPCDASHTTTVPSPEATAAPAG